MTRRSFPTFPSRKRSVESRRIRRSAELRERLFRAALTLFARKGYAETTVEDITEAADVGKGTFFNYFPTKEHILMAFGEMQLGKLEAIVRDAEQSDLPMRDVLRMLVLRMTEEPIRNPAIVRALLQANLSSVPVRGAMLRIHDRNRALLGQLIRHGQERREIRTDLPPEEIAQVWRQTIFGTLLFWSLAGDASLTDRIEQSLERVMDRNCFPSIRERCTAQETNRRQRMKFKPVIIVLVVIAVVVVVGISFGGWFHHDNGLQGSGTVEARNIRVGSEVGGRIDKVLVREGEIVAAGQVLMTFDDKELLASLAQSRANAEKAKRGYRREDIQEVRAAALQAKADYEMRKNGYRQEDIAAAQADLDRAAADETRSSLDFQRYDALAKKDLVSKQQRDTAEANWKMAVAQKDNAQHKLNELQRGYRPEEIASAEARYLQSQATLEKYVRGNRPEDIDAAKAAMAYDEARFRERQVLAPSAASVEVLDVRPGDLISPNTPVATLLERDEIYVRIYIPETEIYRVHVGQKAQITVDSVGRQVFAGAVEQINQQAEFLPRNVQTREERVHQVFGVKIRIDDSSHRVLPGMAADVKLLGEKQ